MFHHSNTQENASREYPQRQFRVVCRFPRPSLMKSTFANHGHHSLSSPLVDLQVQRMPHTISATSIQKSFTFQQRSQGFNLQPILMFKCQQSGQTTPPTRKAVFIGMFFPISMQSVLRKLYGCRPTFIHVPSSIGQTLFLPSILFAHLRASFFYLSVFDRNLSRILGLRVSIKALANLEVKIIKRVDPLKISCRLGNQVSTSTHANSLLLV